MEKIIDKIFNWYKPLMLLFMGFVLGVLYGGFYITTNNEIDSLSDSLFNSFIYLIGFGILMIILKIIFHYKKIKVLTGK